MAARHTIGCDDRAAWTPVTAISTDEHWTSRAACLGSDPDLFFPIGSSGPALRQEAQAKAVCARCPVRTDCLGYALATGQAAGVWGGATEEERREIRAAAPPVLTVTSAVAGTPGLNAAKSTTAK